MLLCLLSATVVSGVFRLNGFVTLVVEVVVATRMQLLNVSGVATCLGLNPLGGTVCVLVIRLRSLRLLRVSGIVMRLRMFLLLITFLKASHSFRNRLLVICKNAYLFATMIMTSVSSPFSCCSGIVRLNLM